MCELLSANLDVEIGWGWDISLRVLQLIFQREEPCSLTFKRSLQKPSVFETSYIYNLFVRSYSKVYSWHKLMASFFSKAPFTIEALHLPSSYCQQLPCMKFLPKLTKSSSLSAAARSQMTHRHGRSRRWQPPCQLLVWNVLCNRDFIA